MKNKLFLLITLFISSLSVNAQIFDPVSWEHQVVVLPEDNSYSIIFSAEIDDTWYMYGMNIEEGGPIPTSFIFTPNANYALVGKPEQTTKPKNKYDDIFSMDIEYHEKHAEFQQKIKLLSEPPFTINATVEYMCCDDNNCLPPKEHDFEITINKAGSTNQSKTTVDSKREEKSESPKGFTFNTIDIGTNDNIREESITETNKTEETKKIDKDKSSSAKDDKSLLLFFFSSMFWGLLGVFTPCVYPMIPMTVSFFMRGSKNKAKGIGNALFFGFSIVAIYTLVGVLMTIFKSNFVNDVVTHWITNFLFFALFVTFAISFFGAFEIVLPASLTNKMDQKADSAGFMGPFFMALTTTLVSFSCTGPLVGKVIVDAFEGDVLRPILGMFGFSLVFALPFTLFAIFPKLLDNMPKSGGWLNSVKVVIGFLVLFFGMKFLINFETGLLQSGIITNAILSRELYLAVWIVLFILLGMYLLGKISFSHDSPVNSISVFRLILIIVSFSFATYLFTGFVGNPLKGLASMLPTKSNISTEMVSLNTTDISNKNQGLCETPRFGDKLHLPYGLNGYFDYEEGLACAKEQGKPLFLDFKGHFCTNCKDMEAKVWSEPEVLEKLRNEFIIVAFFTDDRTKLPEEEWYTSTLDGKVKKTLGKQHADFQATRFNTNTIPLYAIVGHDGELLAGSTYGYNPDVKEFLEYLEKGIEAFKR